MDEGFDLAGVAMIDGHAHPCVDRDAVTARDFAFAFSESDDPAVLDRDVPLSVTMRAAVRLFAARLGVEPDPAAIVAHRNRVGLAEYARALLGPESIRGILLDTGYPKGGLAPADCEALLQVPCREVVRIESVAEGLLPEVRSADELLAALDGALRRLDPGRVVALKTIAAYRCGLGLDEPGAAEAAASFAEESRRYEATGTARLTARPLLSAVVRAALEVAGDLGLPLQVHTGLGDRDLDLRASDPLLLRPLLEDERFAGVPIVLLHAGYPFVRHAAILAALYANAYVDLSLAIPLAAHGGCGIVLDLLEQAPASKILYGSDASVGPELFAWGASVGRAAVASALRSLIADDWLTEEQALDAAGRILAGNARGLYRLEGLD